jgi:hypothetical protein
VYDDSHLGHARNYVSSDIMRRILIHYFNYKVNFVMNITDIDDKIIIRARRKRLLELEKKKDYSAEDKLQLGKKAFETYARNNLPLLQREGEDPLDEMNYAARRDKQYGAVLKGGTLSGEGKPSDAEAKLKMHLANTDAAARALGEGQVFGGADEILLPYLDALYKETVDTSDQSMFTDLTKANERDFLNDMANLNVLPPDSLTRVTEYVPQIAKFVERIVEKGFAYEAEGSVYFDIAAFEKASVSQIGTPAAGYRADKHTGATPTQGCDQKAAMTRHCKRKARARCRKTLVANVERETSRYGSAQKVASHTGTAHGARADQAGSILTARLHVGQLANGTSSILSARSWRATSLAHTSTYTPAVSIWPSHTMTMSWRKVRHTIAYRVISIHGSTTSGT